MHDALGRQRIAALFCPVGDPRKNRLAQRQDYPRSSCDGGRRSLRTRSSGTDTRPETFVVTFAIKT
jgi:hypothetical protein